MSDDYKTWCEMIGRMISKNYDIECITNRNEFEYHRHFVNDARNILYYKRYKNVKLLNVNGLFDGQLYFQTENGELLLIPTRYIISIFPVKNKEK